MRITSPAWSEVATELPTATHEPMDGHDTSRSEAADGVIAWLVQVAPPLAVVSTSP